MLVALVQRCSLLSIPLSMMLALLLRFVSSMKANQILLRAAALAVVLNVALDMLLANAFGVAGIALSTAIVQSATVIYLIVRLRPGTGNTHTGGTPDSPRSEASLETEPHGDR